MPEQDDLVPPFVTRASTLQDAQARRLVDAIRELQWGGTFGHGCPSCGSTREHGHAAGCPLPLALMPDGGIGLLREVIGDGMRRVASRRRSLQALVGAAHRELDELSNCLEWVQDMLNLLEDKG